MRPSFLYGFMEKFTIVEGPLSPRPSSWQAISFVPSDFLARPGQPPDWVSLVESYSQIRMDGEDSQINGTLYKEGFSSLA